MTATDLDTRWLDALDHPSWCAFNLQVTRRLERQQEQDGPDRDSYGLGEGIAYAHGRAGLTALRVWTISVPHRRCGCVRLGVR